MDFKERFHWYSSEELSIIDKNIFDIVKFESDCLMKIFECKENIDSQIDVIAKQNNNTKNELLNTLITTKNELFKYFFINYCKSKKLLEYSDNFSDVLKKFVDVEELVRYNLWVRIFNDVDCNSILTVFKKPLDYPFIYDFIDDFVSSFVDNICDYLIDYLPKDWNIDGYFDYFKRSSLSVIKWKISENSGDFDLNDLFDLISEVLCAYIDEDSVKKLYDNFLLEGTSWWYENDTSSGVSKCVEKLVVGSWLPDFYTSSVDFSSFDWKKIADDTWEFILKYLNSNNEFNVPDQNQFLEKIYWVYLDNEKFEIWKNQFVNRIKLPVKISDIKFSSIKESEDILNFISLMKLKYPKAKNHIWNIGSHKLKDKKLDFFKHFENNFVSKISKLLNSDDFRRMSLVDLFKIMNYYLYILNRQKFDFSSDFVDYLKNFLERSFSESHNLVIKKEEDKELAMQSISQHSNGEKKIVVKDPKVVPVSRKVELSKDLLEDIDFYFTHIDDNPSGGKKDSVLAVLMKISWKHYRKKRFKEFELNDIFFQNLDKNWYICEDDTTDEDLSKDSWKSETIDISEWSEILDDFEWKVDADDILKINLLLSEINNLDDISSKIDKYFEILKILWYSFFKKEQRIKWNILAACKSSTSLFTSFSNTIVNLVNWSQVLEKKEKKWKSMPVFCLDIWWTWYRLVCLHKWDYEKKAIFDIMPHKEYITFLDKKCS